MTDVVGLAIGIVALVDTCVTTCGLVSSAKHFPEDFEVQRVGFLWGESRLRDWAKKWELHHSGNIRTADLQSARLLVEEAKVQAIDLDLIKATLESTEKLLKRCNDLLDRHTHQRSDPTSATIQRFRKSVSSGKSLVQWSVIDATTLRTLVGDLEMLTNGLNRIQPQTNSTSVEIQRLTAASRTMATLDQLGITPNYHALNGYPEIKQLFLMRSEHSRIETVGRSWARSKDLQVTKSEYNVWYDSVTSGSARGPGRFGSSRDAVLIEWKYYMGSNQENKELALSRTERIAELLAVEGKPRGFRILDCVGWFLDESHSRCGIMFSIPRHIEMKAREAGGSVRCLSLSDLIAQRTKPTLRERFHLAYLLTMSLVELHLAKWLHKNFSSDNIIFLAAGKPNDSDLANNLGVDFTAPYVASFGLARPDQHDAVSSLAMASAPVNKAYQHPDYSPRTVDNEDSFIPMARYHKAYDLYSLGCVLLEISIWKPLAELGWAAFTDNPQGWKDRLLYVIDKNVAFHAGPIYKDIVLSCMNAEANPSPHAGDGGPMTNSSAETFGWDVLRKLDQLSV
ncbi:hypothetical protein FGADI_12953 [Fusarium gaditjirri]|uniref:Protein kinase domain-containing protein n=1 Tax=Fusarium gaditjirri TaxID=282569 RepID=A0A8H4WNF5_9HYPO|nr:hypothetical protein FGADI_12953 [Fusarium gaditjirri]